MKKDNQVPKAGVKGIADSGTSEIPDIFINKEAIESGNKPTQSQFSIPVIDLEGVRACGSVPELTISKLRDVCQEWGFFQIINHGIPADIMAEMMDGTRRFHEQDSEIKKLFYSRDISKTFFYNSNFDLYEAKSANWRDTFQCALAPQSPDPTKMPQVCRYNVELISNDVFKSSVHTVIPKKIGPRISVACLFLTNTQQETLPRLYGPIKELLSKENPPI
ncbi:oxidoreductase [Lithospermum erythrorhizon]|uniref:Oxidoreductase n=1 Tax=Lithospermum erythrorhizon TaxID=34254 RepID=A0AAV3QKJ8_LITER